MKTTFSDDIDEATKVYIFTTLSSYENHKRFHASHKVERKCPLLFLNYRYGSCASCTQLSLSLSVSISFSLSPLSRARTIHAQFTRPIYYRNCLCKRNSLRLCTHIDTCADVCSVKGMYGKQIRTRRDEERSRERGYRCA